MRSFTIVLMGIIMFFAFNTGYSADEGKEKMSETIDYLIRIRGTRPDWPDNMTDRETKVMHDHFLYLKKLTEEKKVLMAGPVFDERFGLVILRVQDEREAVSIMDKEPSVVAGVHTYEIHPMKVSLMAEL